MSVGKLEYRTPGTDGRSASHACAVDTTKLKAAARRETIDVNVAGDKRYSVLQDVLLDPIETFLQREPRVKVTCMYQYQYHYQHRQHHQHRSRAPLVQGAE